MANFILTRIARLFRAKAHDALDNIEDPGAIARQMVRELSAGIAEHEETTVSVIADQMVLTGKRDKAKNESSEWNEKAKQAVAAQRDDLATAALERASRAERNLASYEKSLLLLTPKVDALKSRLADLRAQHADADNEAELIDARAKSAKATSRANRLLGGVGDTPVNFDGLRQRVDKIEAASDALGELARDKSGTNLDAELAGLSVPSVSMRLAELKDAANQQVGEVKK